MDRWIVTSATREFLPYLTRFVASLRDVARYHGHLLVFDYGLGDDLCRRLEDHGIQVARPLGTGHLVVDRYLSLADRFEDLEDATVLYFDADIWFAEPFDELWSDQNLHTTLGATKDVWECDYYFRCSAAEHHGTIRRLLDDVIRNYGQTLQAGFVAGSSGAWLRFVDLLRALLNGGVGKPQWGMDAVALNAYAHLHANHFTLLPITYNAPPPWGIVREHGRFIATRFDHDGLRREDDGPLPVKAIHCTSPYRGPRKTLDFKEFHPELLAEWSLRLGNSDSCLDDPNGVEHSKPRVSERSERHPG